MFLELCLLAGVLAFLRLYVFKSRAERLYAKFPGPRSYPIIGSVLEFDYPRVEVTETLKRLSFQYGPVCLIRLGTEPVVCLRNPSDVEIILGSTTEIEKSQIYWPLYPWLNQGLLTSKGDLWRRHRKILTPAFHFKVLEKFVPVFVRNTRVMLNKFSQIVGQEFNVMNYVKLCTLDVIIETSMGLKVDAQVKESEYLKAVEGILEIVAHRNFDFLHRSFLFKLLPVGRRHDKLVAYLHKVTEDVMKERKEKLMKTQNEKLVEDHEIGIKDKKVFLDLLLQFNIEGAGLSDREIREEVDTFLFEGYDTTSSTISFCLYSLSQNQEVQNTVYEEVCSILGNTDRDLTYEDLQEMKYLNKVIKETLRRFPTVQFIGRQTSKDMELKSGYIVPANTSIVVMIEAMHHDPTLYPDPYKFDPDRFDSKAANPYGFVPFSAGPRNCIGQKYAMLEIKATVCLILLKFRLLPSEVPITPWFTLVLKSKTGIHLKLEPRPGV